MTDTAFFDHAFFDHVRKAPFNGKLAQSQVDGLNVLITAWREHGDGWNVDRIAYYLATVYHETDQKMQPIAEYGHGRGKPYGHVDETGKAPYGRGYVQLTWRDNYVKADVKLKLDGHLAKDYDLALDPLIASQIAVRGMIEGWFTGKKLADYIHEGMMDFVNARRIINGTDRAVTISQYADAFRTALKLNGGTSP